MEVVFLRANMRLFLTYVVLKIRANEAMNLSKIISCFQGMILFLRIRRRVSHMRVSSLNDVRK